MINIYIKKALVLFSLSSITSFAGLFGFSIENEPSLLTIPIIEAPENTMPGWEKQIIELYHDSEGDPIPVVFRGAAKNWEAASWTPEYFAEHFGDIQIEILSQNLLEHLQEYAQIQNADAPVCQALQKYISERILVLREINGIIHEEYEYYIIDDLMRPTCPKLENDNASDLKTIDTTIKDHISDILLNPKNAGYLFCPLEHNVTEDQLKSTESGDLPKNAFFVYNYLNLEHQTHFPQSIVKKGADSRRAYSLFIGSGNSITSLHSHGSTFLAQMYGKKVASLVHPNDIEKCSCLMDDEFAQSCSIDIAAPNFEKYPKLKGLNVYQTILEPGDVLYIPHAWLHDIRGIDTSISISSGF